jgi:hypothetical protein
VLAVADTSPAAQQFKIAELAFRRFINRDRVFSVKVRCSAVILPGSRRSGSNIL